MASLCLVEMPFKGVNRPSIGLSLLRAAATEAGYSCEIRYANLPFAARIGFDLYEFIAEEVAQESLFGDLVFGPMVHGRHRSGVALPGPQDDRPASQRVPDWLWDRLPELQRAARDFVDDLAEELIDGGHACFGLSSMFQVLPNVALARALKARRPDGKIVLGGACCEGEMGLALHEEYPWIDYVCRGEGERFVVQLLDHLATGRPAGAAIPGLVARVGPSSAASGEHTERIRDMESLPMPDYRDWAEQVDGYAGELRREDFWLPLETSRGCWWGQKNHCIFCGLNGENMAFREKGADRVRLEIRECMKYGIKKISFVDLILPLGYFETLLPRLAADDLGLTLFYEVKANLSHRQLELLAAAGVRLLQPGIESLSTPILQLMKKGVTGFQNIRLLKWAAELGVDVSWNLLYGFPGEDPEEYREMARLVPLIAHLQPPIGGCRPVRIDRFSPLFFDRGHFGIEALRPVRPYESVFGLPPERVARMAYFFEVDGEGGPDLDRPGYRELLDAVAGWSDRRSEVSLTSVDLDDRTEIFDRRAIAGEAHVVLEGPERAVYSACQQGTTLRALSGSMDVSPSRVADILESLVGRHLILARDGFYLSLAVGMDRWIPRHAPDSILGSLCHGIHRSSSPAPRSTLNLHPTSGPLGGSRP